MKLGSGLEITTIPAAGGRIAQEKDSRETEKRNNSTKQRKTATNGSNTTGEHEEVQMGAPLAEAGSMRSKRLAGARKTGAEIAERIDGRILLPSRAEDIIAKKTALTEIANSTPQGQSPTLTFVKRTNTSNLSIENSVGPSVLDEWQLGEPQKYFKPVYTRIPLEGIGCDAALLLHPNGLVVVCLAPYHPAILKVAKESGKCQVRFSKSLNFTSEQLKGRK